MSFVRIKESHFMQSWMEISTIFHTICSNFNVVTIFELFICYAITSIFYFYAILIYLQIVRKICISSLSFLFPLFVVREITHTIKNVNKYNFRIKLKMVKTSIGITTIRHVNWSSTKLCATFCPLGNVSSLIGPMLLYGELTF